MILYRLQTEYEFISCRAGEVFFYHHSKNVLEHFFEFVRPQFVGRNEPPAPGQAEQRAGQKPYKLLKISLLARAEGAQKVDTPLGDVEVGGLSFLKVIARKFGQKGIKDDAKGGKLAR